MPPRLTLALRAGARAALAALVLQAAVAMALAAALPEVGHVHPAGTPDHAHALVEVGGLAVTPEPRAQAPRPESVRAPRGRPRVWPPHLRGPRRTRWGRAPPGSGRARPVVALAA